MPKASQAAVTVDELIATLNHSDLPTLIVEGGDDLIVFRRLEERADNLSLSILPVQGRSRVLELFDRKDEIRNPKVIFAADRDIWSLTSPPAQYQSNRLLLTNGYSIENDAYQDAQAERLLYGNELTEFEQELQIFVRWYALAISRHLTNASIEYKKHPNEILDNVTHRALLMQLNEGETYPKNLHDQILQDYRALLRGKSLLSLFVRQMKPSRLARHSAKSILELAATAPGANIHRLFSAAEALLK